MAHNTFLFSSMIDESLSTSVLSDEPLQRGGRLLVSSDGYNYGVKVGTLVILLNSIES